MEAFVLDFQGALGDPFYSYRDPFRVGMTFLLEESRKKFGEQRLYVFSGQYGKREIEDISRKWSSLFKG